MFQSPENFLILAVTISFMDVINILYASIQVTIDAVGWDQNKGEHTEHTG